MLALITGATGLLGRHLVDVLREEDVHIRALVRPSSDITHLKSRGVALVFGAAGDDQSIRSAVAGVDLIFHVAGYLTADAPFGVDGKGAEEWPLYQLINVDFTQSLLTAAVDAAARRFVYVSSNSVYGLDVAVPTPEDAQLNPVSMYGRSKLMAEQRVMACQGQGLATTIIRPPIIYGPGDRYFMPMALRLAKLPILPLMNGGRNLMDLIFASDVARLLWLAAMCQAAEGQVYNAGPGRPTTLYDLVQAYQRVTGRRSRILNVQPKVAIRTAFVSRLLAKPFFPEMQGALTSEGLAIMSKDFHLDMSRAEQDLGFQAKIDLDEGLAQTLQ